MIDLVKAWYKGKVKHYEQLAEQSEMLEQSQHHLEKLLTEASNIVTERSDDGGWDRVGISQMKGHNYADQQSMIRQARRFYRYDANGKAALTTILYYIIGEGVKITPQSKDPKVHKLWREFWKSKRNGIGGMKIKSIEMVLRALRDGECLIQYYSQDEDGAASWKTTVRFRDPMLLQTPPLEYRGMDQQTADGVLADIDDPEKIIKYFFRKTLNSTIVDVVPAEQIQHVKILADSDQKRGESYIQAVMPLFSHYKDWMDYRIVLNKVRTAIVLIKKITGGSADVSSIKATIGTSPTARTGETKRRVPPPGTMITANAGVDYEFKSPNINASDAAEDGRNLKLSMAAGTNLPEYVFGDASNANFASTMIAESPFVKGVKYWQLFFEAHMQEMFRRVVQNAVDAKALTAPAEEDIFTTDVQEAGDPLAKGSKAAGGMGAQANPEDEIKQGEDRLAKSQDLTQVSEAEAFFGCDVQWPEVIHREVDKTTNALIAQVEAGLVSEATASSILGHDYDEEVRRQQIIEDEADTNPFKQKQNALDAQDALGNADQSAEMDAVIGDMTPEEIQAMAKNSPDQIKAMMRSKMAAHKEKK